ncbi:TPA: peptidyl-tRNA hydrolase [Candidatus Micrarchaeota archaeon]|nr:peptidyl-tRNA hydrolase [Candidatus Micrarchaeota archaeon]
MYKQTIIIRSDLKMGKGKIGGQCSHASVSAYNVTRKKFPEIANEWEQEGQKKIVLKVEGESELLEQFRKAKDAGIPCELIRDAGHTQVEPGTITCIGIGPWNERKLDELFGKLKLL